MFPQDSRSFQHIVPDVKSLLFLIAFDLMMETKIIESNEAVIKLQNNLYILHKLINNGEIHLECSCSIVMSCIRYLEIQKYNSFCASVRTFMSLCSIIKPSTNTFVPHFML